MERIILLEVDPSYILRRITRPVSRREFPDRSWSHPARYLTLTADPEVGEDVHEGIARTVFDDERRRLWEQMVSIWPDYDEYQTRTDREMPVVVIETI